MRVNASGKGVRGTQGARSSASGSTDERKRTRGTSGSLRTEAPSHLQPLGLWCPKQPPRSSRGCRTAGGGEPRGPSPPSRAPSRLAAPGVPRTPDGLTFRRSRRAHRLGPRGPLRRWGFPIGSLRVLPVPSRPIHLSVSRPPVRPSRVDHLDCLERGERYRRHQGRSTSHPRRSGHERAGRRSRTKSDNSVDVQCPRRRRSSPVGDVAKPSRVTDITMRSTHAPPFQDRSGNRPSTTKPHFS
ncbi:MAG: hypothetical protein K0R20_1195 [Actinomycetia bacterium]|nr:hypothetical protein [Actinomycetes bacterium]